jgi:hypothetical protein
MFRWATAAVVLAAAVGVAADPPKDTRMADFTRTRKLKGTVTVEVKDVMLKDILAAMSEQLQEKKLGLLMCRYDDYQFTERTASLSVKDVPADEVLDQLLGSLDLGYVVLSRDKDRYDGWLKIVSGKARGYEPGREPKEAAKPEEKPKPAEKPAEASADDETAAAAKLDSAKKLLADKRDDEAKKLLKYVTKFHPTTKAAAEAKKLLADDK